MLHAGSITASSDMMKRKKARLRWDAYTPTGCLSLLGVEVSSSIDVKTRDYSNCECVLLLLVLFVCLFLFYLFAELEQQMTAPPNTMASTILG